MQQVKLYHYRWTIPVIVETTNPPATLPCPVAEARGRARRCRRLNSCQPIGCRALGPDRCDTNHLRQPLITGWARPKGTRTSARPRIDGNARMII